MGIARLSSTGSLDSTQNFKTVAELKTPPFTNWAADAVLDKTADYTVAFIYKDQTNAPQWYTSNDDGPMWTGTMPLTGYIGICQYFPQCN